jgi:hypothetical protein
VNGSWEPTVDDIEKLDSRLSRVSKLQSHGEFIADPSSYYRQYIGIIIGGHKLIYVNAFAFGKLPSDWRKRLVDICDGGTSAWGVLYDPKTSEFSELATNGTG